MTFFVANSLCSVTKSINICNFIILSDDTKITVGSNDLRPLVGCPTFIIGANLINRVRVHYTRTMLLSIEWMNCDKLLLLFYISDLFRATTNVGARSTDRAVLNR